MDDPRQEIARLREHLHRVQQVCELHRKLGEDTAFEVRETRRKAEQVQTCLTQFLQQYTHFADLVEIDGTSQMKQSLEQCDAMLKRLSKAILAF